MKLLFISHEHALMPFAWRAKRQGHEVSVLVGNQRYAHAWEGRLPKLDVATADRAALHAAVRELVVEQNIVVLTDSRDWTAALAGVPQVFGVGPHDPPGEPGVVEIALGGWWNGTAWTHRHLLFTERGAWTGGLGPALPGAILFVQPSSWRPAWDEALELLHDRLKAASFVGLVRVRLQVTSQGGLEPSGLEAGWPLFHAHALLADPDEEIGGLLEGTDPPPGDRRFHVVLPVSVPPWPHRAPHREEPRAIVFPRELTRWVFWHDLAVGADGSMGTAGLGGLVGVVRGLGRTIAGARRMAGDIAERIGVAEKQYRTDGGEAAELLWSQLVEMGVVD